MADHTDEGVCLCGCTEDCAVVAELRQRIAQQDAVIRRMVREDSDLFALSHAAGQEVDSRRPSDASIVRVFRDACAADLQHTGKRNRELQRIYDLAARLDDIASSKTHGRQDCSPVSDPAPSE